MCDPLSGYAPLEYLLYAPGVPRRTTEGFEIMSLIAIATQRRAAVFVEASILSIMEN
jgi:hypothetical protein